MAISTPTTSGQILTSAYVNNNINSGLVYVAGASFSAVSELLVDSVFTSTYRNYRLVFDCQSSAAAGEFRWQMRAAGSTISTNTYNFTAMDIVGASITSRAFTAQASIRFGANDASGYNASTVDIFCPQLAQPTRLISAFNRTSGTVVENAWSANTNSTAYDGFRINVTTGTMTGAYVLYGCRNA